MHTLCRALEDELTRLCAPFKRYAAAVERGQGGQLTSDTRVKLPVSAVFNGTAADTHFGCM